MNSSSVSRPQRLVMLTGLTVLVLAPLASAECAWVLWVEEDRLDYTANTRQLVGWTVIQGTTTEAQCQEKMRAQIDGARYAESQPKGQVLYKMLPDGRGINLLFFDTNDPKETANRSQILVYTCLPDTVDPRGPKGK